MIKLIVLSVFYFALMINSYGQSPLFEGEYQSKIRMEHNANTKVSYYLILNNYYYEIGDFEKGDKLLTEMQEYVSMNNLPIQKGINYYCKAIEMDNNNVGDKKTLEYLFLAIEEFEHNEDELLSCSAYLFSGNIFMMGGRYREEAYKYFLLALDAANKSNNFRFQAHANNGVGVVLYSLGDYENSIQYLKKALVLFKQEENFYEMGNLFNNISANYLKQNMLDSALHYVEKGIQLNGQDGSLQNSIRMSYTKAIIYFKQENYTIAKSLALQLNKIAEENKMDSWRFQLLTLLGKVALKQKQTEKANKYLLDARRLDATIDNQLILDRLLITEAELYESIGNFKKSSLLYKESLMNKDSIEKKVKIGELMKLNNLYEFENLKRTNEDLSNKRRLAEKQSKHRIQIIYLLMFSALIFAILISILYKQKRQQVLANKLLVLKNRSLVQQANVKNKDDKNTNDKNSYELPKDKMEELYLKVNVALEKDKLFLDKEITIDKFSKTLNSNRTYVSKVIKKYYDKNFNALINEYRIKELLLFFEKGLHKEFTLESLSIKAGFKSKSVFHQSFKSHTGLTPKYYLREMEKD